MLPIFVVNLARDQGRRQRVAQVLEAHGLEAVYREAVDGAALDSALIDTVYDATRNSLIFKRPLSRPEIGCYLSHLALWREIAAGEAPGAIILEDDFEGRPGLTAVLERLSGLDLGDSVVKLFIPRLGLNRVRMPLTDGHMLVQPWIAPACTTGYVISRAAAQKLVAQAIPFARPVDLDLKHWWEFDITILAVSPSVVVPANRGDSTIEPERRRTAVQFTLVQRFVRNLKYQGHYHSRLTRASLRRWRERARAARGRGTASPFVSTVLRP